MLALYSNVMFCAYCVSLFNADISLVQDNEVGDGTTSVTVLACELLKVGSVMDPLSL